MSVSHHNIYRKNSAFCRDKEQNVLSFRKINYFNISSIRSRKNCISGPLKHAFTIVPNPTICQILFPAIMQKMTPARITVKSDITLARRKDIFSFVYLVIMKATLS